MKLSALIRKKHSVDIATAIPAIFATQQGERGATVARIATVAVANPTEQKTERLLPPSGADIRPAANEPSIADWKTLDRAYLAHHVQCPQCIAAGKGYGQRCGAGATLWRQYEAAPTPFDRKPAPRPAAMPADLVDLLQAAMLACDFWGDSADKREAMRQHCLTVPVHQRRELTEHFHELYGRHSHD